MSYISLNLKQLFRFVVKLREAFFVYFILTGLLSVQANKVIADWANKSNFENALAGGMISLIMLIIYVSLYNALHFDYHFLKTVMSTDSLKRCKIIKVCLANVYWLLFLVAQVFVYNQLIELLYFPILSLIGLVIAELFYRISSRPNRKSVLSVPIALCDNLFIFESLLTRKIRNLSWYALLLYLAVFGAPFLLLVIVLNNLSYEHSSSYTLFPLLLYMIFFHALLFQKDRSDHYLIKSLNNRYKHVIANSESNVFVLLICILGSIQIALAYLISDTIDIRREFSILAIFTLLSKVLFYKAAYWRELSFGRIALRITLYLVIFFPLMFFV